MLFMNDGDGVSIPDVNDFPDYSFLLAGILTVSNTANVSVTIPPSAYVSRDALDDALNGKLIVLWFPKTETGVSETQRVVNDERIQTSHRVTRPFVNWKAPIYWETGTGKITLQCSAGFPDLMLYLTR